MAPIAIDCRGGQPAAREPHVALCLVSRGSFPHALFLLSEYFIVALDESCDIQDKPQLAILVRFISTDCLIKEELLDIVPLKDRTRGIDVKEAMMAAIEKANLPTAKLTATIMNGAPAVIGSVNGLVGLCKAEQTFPEFSLYHSQGATRV